MASYNLGTAAGRIVIDAAGAEKGFSSAQAAAQSFTEVVRNQVDAVDKFANKMLVAGASGTGAMLLLSNSAAAFEERLSAIQAVSGATAEEMDLIGRKALEIGKRTAFSATESASAMEELIKAGLSVTDVLNGASDATVDLAAAGEISLPRAAEIAANAMNNFGLAGKDMPRIADLIAGAANASAISVEELGSSLSQVGAVAALVGMPFDDVAVAIAEMGNAGIKGSDAGTSLKTMFMNLIPSTDRQIDKFKQLGLYTVNSAEGMQKLAARGIKPVSLAFDDVTKALQQYIEDSGGSEVGTAANTKAAMELGQQMGVLQNSFFDANGEVKSLAEIQQILADTTGDMTKEQQLMNLEILFGADAIRAAAVLSKEGAAGYNEMAAAMGKVGAQEVAATRLDNLRGSLEEFRGSMETLSIDIGTYFLKPFKRMVDVGTAVLNFFLDMPDWVKAATAGLITFGTSLAFLTGGLIKVIPWIAAFVARSLGLKAAGMAWGVLSAGVSTFRATSGNAAATLAIMSTRAREMGGWLATLAGRAKTLGGAAVWIVRFASAFAAFATGPVGIAIAIVGGLALLGKILYDRWEPFRNLVDRIGASIRDFFVPIIEQAKNGLKALVDTFQTGAEGGTGFIGAMSRLGNILRTVWDVVEDLGDAFMQNVWPAIQQLGAAVGGAFMQAWESLVQVWNSSLKPALTELWAVIVNQLWPAFKQFVAAVWPIVRIVGIVAGVIIGVLLVALYGIVMFLLTKVLPVLIRFTTFILVNLIGALAALAGWIVRSLIAPLIRVISFILSRAIPIFQVLASVVTWQFQLISKVIGAVVGFVLGWFRRLTGGARGAADETGGAFTRIVEWIRNAWNTIVSIVSTIFMTLTAPWRAVAAFLMPLVSAVFGFIGTVITGFVRIGISILSFFWAVVKTLFEIGVLLIRVLLSGLAVFWSGVWNGIVSVATAVWNAIYRVISSAFGAVWAIIRGYLNLVKSFWTGIWNGILAVVAAIWRRIGPTVLSGLNSIRNFFHGVTTAIRTVWNGMWSRLSSAVDSARSAITGKVNGVVSAVKSPFSNAINWLREAGRNIIEGLVGGITSKINAARDAVLRVGERIKSSLSSLLELGSPSKWGERVGKWTVQGIERGLEKQLASLSITAAKVGAITMKGVVPTIEPRSTSSVVRVEQPAPSLTVNNNITAPQNMDPDQLATMAARRTGYVLAGNVSRIASPVVRSEAA
jgi:TP901 family phage tail tape measure protein